MTPSFPKRRTRKRGSLPSIASSRLQMVAFDLNPSGPWTGRLSRLEACWHLFSQAATASIHRSFVSLKYCTCNQGDDKPKHLGRCCGAPPRHFQNDLRPCDAACQRVGLQPCHHHRITTFGRCFQACCSAETFEILPVHTCHSLAVDKTISSSLAVCKHTVASN